MESRSASVEKPLLPTVENRWLQSQLAAQTRLRHFVRQMPPQNGYFLFPGIVLGLSSHAPSPLAEEVPPVPAGPRHRFQLPYQPCFERANRSSPKRLYATQKGRLLCGGSVGSYGTNHSLPDFTLAETPSSAALARLSAGHGSA